MVQIKEQAGFYWHNIFLLLPYSVQTYFVLQVVLAAILLPSGIGLLNLNKAAVLTTHRLAYLFQV